MDKFKAWLSNSVGSSQHDNYAFKDRNTSSFLHWGSDFEYKLCTSFIRNVGDLLSHTSRVQLAVSYLRRANSFLVIFYMFNSNIFWFQ